MKVVYRLSDSNIPLNFLRTLRGLFDQQTKIYISVFYSLLILLIQDINNCLRVRQYSGRRCSLRFDFKKCFIFQGLLCTQREGVFYIVVTWFVVGNFVFVQTVRVSTPSLALRRDFEVVPLATSTGGLAIRRTGCFAALVGIFWSFLLYFSFSWLLLRDFQPCNLANSTSSIISFWISIQPTQASITTWTFYILLWRPGFLRISWPFQRLETVGLVAVSANLVGYTVIL